MCERQAILSRFLLFAVLLMGTASANAEQFFGDEPPEGWFWYALPPAPVEPKPEPQEPPKPTPPASAKVPKPAEAAPAPAGPAAFSAAWLRENLPKYLDRAVDEPNRRNVLTYMYLQRLAIDKSQRFADAVEATVKTTPALDENTRRPLSGLGARLSNRRAERAREAAMATLSERLGLWFFYSSACTYCASQASILADLREIHGITITAIGIDASPAPGNFKPARADTGQAERLGTAGPLALVLVNPHDRQIVPLSHGLLSRDQLTARILLAAHEAGWLGDDLYNRTRPMRAEALITAGQASPAAKGGADSPVPLSPDAILGRLRGETARRGLGVTYE